MEKFKVVCKAEASGWTIFPVGTKIVTKSSLFGLIKHTSVVSDPNHVPGPSKEEICIVYDTYQDAGMTFYRLEGYPVGGYNSKWFIRLEEFTETQKEIAEKAECAVN